MVVGHFSVCFLNHLYDYIYFVLFGICYRVYRSQGICVDWYLYRIVSSIAFCHSCFGFCDFSTAVLLLEVLDFRVDTDSITSLSLLFFSSFSLHREFDDYFLA